MVTVKLAAFVVFGLVAFAQALPEPGIFSSGISYKQPTITKQLVPVVTKQIVPVISKRVVPVVTKQVVPVVQYKEVYTSYGGGGHGGGGGYGGAGGYGGSGHHY